MPPGVGWGLCRLRPCPAGSAARIGGPGGERSPPGPGGL